MMSFCSVPCQGLMQMPYSAGAEGGVEDEARYYRWWLPSEVC